MPNDTKHAVMLTREDIAFAILNCDQNIQLGIQMLVIEKDHAKIMKIHEYNRNFTSLKQACIDAAKKVRSN